MMVMHIEKPDGKLLADWFEEMRDWLDANKCEAVRFSSVGRGAGRPAYRVAFEDAAEAGKFAAQFAACLVPPEGPVRAEEGDLAAAAPTPD